MATNLPGTENRLPSNADVERPLLNSVIDRFGSRTAIGQEPTYELHLTSKELDNFKLDRPPGRA